MLFSRKRYDVFKAVSRVIEKAAKFETQSHINIEEKLQPFLEICDISKVVSPSSGAEKVSPLSPKRSESPVVVEQGRGKRPKIPSWKIRRNLEKEFENIENVEPIEQPAENDNDADTEESDDETEFKPKRKKKRAKKQRPEYQNTLNLMWGRFRLSLTLIALVINTVCEDLGITDRSKYVSVTRLTNLLKRFDEMLLNAHTENNFGFPDCGKNLSNSQF